MFTVAVMVVFSALATTVAITHAISSKNTTNHLNFRSSTNQITSQAPSGVSDQIKLKGAGNSPSTASYLRFRYCSQLSSYQSISGPYNICGGLSFADSHDGLYYGLYLSINETGFLTRSQFTYSDANCTTVVSSYKWDDPP